MSGLSPAIPTPPALPPQVFEPISTPSISPEGAPTPLGQATGAAAFSPKEDSASEENTTLAGKAFDAASASSEGPSVGVPSAPAAAPSRLKTPTSRTSALRAPMAANVLPWRSKKTKTFSPSLLYQVYEHLENRGAIWIAALAIGGSAPFFFATGPGALIITFMLAVLSFGACLALLHFFAGYFAHGPLPELPLREKSYALFQRLSRDQKKSVMAALKHLSKNPQTRSHRPFDSLINWNSSIREDAWASAIPIFSSERDAAAHLLGAAIRRYENSGAPWVRPSAREYALLNLLGPAGHSELLDLAMRDGLFSPENDLSLAKAIESGITEGGWSQASVNALKKILSDPPLRLLDPGILSRLRNALNMPATPESLSKAAASGDEIAPLIAEAHRLLEGLETSSILGKLRQKTIETTIQDLENALSRGDKDSANVLSERLKRLLNDTSVAPSSGNAGI